MFGYDRTVGSKNADSFNFPSKHKALYIAGKEQTWKMDVVNNLLGNGVLLELTSWGNFARNIDEWVDEFDVLIFTSSSDTIMELDHLETASAQDVADALAKWKNAGNKFIYFTNASSVVIKKKNIDGADAESVNVKSITGLITFDQENGTLGVTAKDIVDVSNNVLGASPINRSDLNLKAYSMRKLILGNGEIPIISATNGVDSEYLVIYKPNQYCVVSIAGLKAGDNTGSPMFKYVDTGVLARALLGNTTSLSLAEDCIYSKKIAASGFDCDVTSETKGIQAIIDAYNGKSLELGLVVSAFGATDAEKEELASWYRSRFGNIDICSHSTYHYTAPNGTVAESDETHVIPSSRVITLKYPFRPAISSVTIDAATLTESGWTAAVTTGTYGFDKIGRLKFHADHIGKSVVISYSRLKEAEEWLGSLTALKELGILTKPVCYLTGGEHSLSSYSVVQAKKLGYWFCDHVSPWLRVYYLLMEKLIQKMPPTMGHTNETGFYHWEELVRAGYSKADIETVYTPAMLDIMHQRKLPFLWYGHDFMFSETDANSIWISTAYNADWKKSKLRRNHCIRFGGTKNLLRFTGYGRCALDDPFRLLHSV